MYHRCARLASKIFWTTWNKKTLKKPLELHYFPGLIRLVVDMKVLTPVMDVQKKVTLRITKNDPKVPTHHKEVSRVSTKKQDK